MRGKVWDCVFRTGMVVAGSAVMGLSIDLLVMAGFGLDPLSLFQAGLSHIFSISLGRASQILMLGIMAVLLVIDRKRVGIGSILNSVLVGAFVNLFSVCIPAGGVERLWIAVLAVIAGFLLMGIGIGTYISAHLGEAGVDALMMFLAEKYRLHVRVVRISLDVALALAGFLMGGRLGWATLVSVLVNGYVIQMTITGWKYLRKSGGA
ncbi:MAG: YitT family protein [Hungatella hathewayi]|nr:YitT family protein [Hungatella hathewayi]